MSVSRITLDSVVLGKSMAMTVYRPEGTEDRELPVLFFLHGRSGDETLMETLGMDELADEMIPAGQIRPLMIVCPCMDNSRGINSAEEYEEAEGFFDEYGIIGTIPERLINQGFSRFPYIFQPPQGTVTCKFS